MLLACFVNSHSLGSNKQLFQGRLKGWCTGSQAENVPCPPQNDTRDHCVHTNSLFVIEEVIIKEAFILSDQVTPALQQPAAAFMVRAHALLSPHTCSH